VTVLHLEQALVGEGDAMRVAADVLQDLLRTGEGACGIDDPVGLPRGLQMRGEVRPLGQGVEGAGEVQPPGLERLLQ